MLRRRLTHSASVASVIMFVVLLGGPEKWA